MSDGPYSARDTGEKEHGINWFDLVGPNVNVGDNVGDSLSVKQMAKYANIGYAACQSQLAEANERVKELEAETHRRSEEAMRVCKKCSQHTDKAGMCLCSYKGEKPQWTNQAERATDELRVTCTKEEREVLDFMYAESTCMKDEGVSAFYGEYVHWDKIIDTCDAAGNKGYSQSPIELVLQIINERDELRTQLSAANERLKELTERAVRAEKVVAECEASGFVTKDGTARKVNGTLCLDDDGVIVADGATVYFVDEFGDIVEYDCRGIEGSIPSGLFWSTKEALDKARKQGGRA